MPWCPKCKNEYKEGYSVCADCGCKLVDEIGAEMVGYFGTEEEIDNIIEYLDSEGFDFTYKRYNSKDGQYELILQESMKAQVRDAMVKYIRSHKNAEESESDMSSQTTLIEDDEEIVVKRYKKPLERAAEYKAGAQTLLFVGFVGIAFLVLMDVGVVKLNFTTDRRMLINIVMGGMFLLFVILGFASVKTYKKLLSQSKVDDELERNIVEWFNANITVEKLTAGEDKKTPEEMLFFNRFKTLKSSIKSQFPDIEASFLEYMTDKLYNELFK